MSDLTTRLPPPPPPPTSSSTSSPESDMIDPPLSSASTLNEREQIRLEFYRTYDVMTGVRIAATLSGFFGMIVLMVVYKSRCRYGKSAISDVQLAAAAVAVEEEEQQDAVAAALYMQTLASSQCPRRSLGSMSAPPLTNVPLQPGSLSLLGQGGVIASSTATSCNPSTVRLGLRFSSLGGHSLLNPPTHPPVSKKGSRRASCVPIRHTDPMDSGRGFRYPAPQRAHSADSDVPAVRTTLGVIESSPDQPSGSDTPPCSASVSMSMSASMSSAGMYAGALSSPVDPEDYPGFPGDFGERPPRRAPLARISTCGNSRDAGDDRSHSVGSDSVFIVGGDEVDTEDEVDEFSTDSDTFRPSERTGTARLRHFPRRPLSQLSPSAADAPLCTASCSGTRLGVPSDVPERHLSAPDPAEVTTPTNATPVTLESGISNSQSCRTLKAPTPTPGPSSVLYSSGSTALPPSDTSSSESILLDPDGMKSAAVLKISIHESASAKSRELLQARPKVFASLDSAASDERSQTPDQAPTVLSKRPASDEELVSESASGRRLSEHLSLKVLRKQRKLSCDDGRCPQRSGTRFVTSASCDVLNKHLVVTLEPEETATQPSWSQETLF